MLTPVLFWLQNLFFQTMSIYIRLKPQFNADQSFLRNYGLKMYGFQNTGGQSPWWHHHFSEEFSCFFGHILTYIPLELQFNAEQSFLGNHWSENVWFSRYRESKSMMTPAYFKRVFLFFQICQFMYRKFTPIKIFKGFMCL